MDGTKENYRGKLDEKILIIDREADIRKALEALMEKNGYRAKGFSHSQKAIAALKSESFDLVIMDINMPGENGLEIMRYMKRLGGNINIIVLTGQTSIDNVRQTLRRDGAFDFFSKPLENEAQLISSVKQALEISQKKRENKMSEQKNNHENAENHPSDVKRILIVDDNVQFQSMLSKMLSNQQYETTVASDGFEAGIKVIEFKPDLILLDLIMPGIDGIEVCKKIKQNSSTREIRILVFTGYDTEEKRKQILEAGADGYLAKPFRLNTLLSAVYELLSDSR